MAEVKERLRRVEEKIDYAPFYPYQVNFHRSPRRFKVLVAGARGGKTMCAGHECVDKAIAQPGYSEFQLRTKEPYTILVGVKVLSWLDSVILPLLMKAVPKQLHVGGFHHTRRTFTIRGVKGLTTFRFIHGNPDSWISTNANGFWIDEFCQCEERLFDEAMTRIGNNRGWGILSGTPHGPNWAYNRIYRAYLNGEWRDPMSKEELLYFSTWRTCDNPTFSRDELELKRRTMPSRYFRRTYEATWDAFEGQVYEEFHSAVNCRPRGMFSFVLPRGRRRIGDGPTLVFLDRVVAGVDWGFATKHPGTIVILGRTKAGNWYVLEESVEEGLYVRAATLTTDSWIKRAAAFKAKWEVTQFWCDPESPENIRHFRDHGLPAEPAENARLPGIETVAKYIHVDPRTNLPGFIVLSDCRRAIDELTNYHWDEKREVPVKVEDHVCDAIRYGIYSEEVHGGFVPARGVGILG